MAEQTVYDSLKIPSLESQSAAARRAEEEEKERIAEQERQYATATIKKILSILKRDMKRLKGEIITAMLFIIITINLVVMTAININDFIRLSGAQRMCQSIALVTLECLLPFAVWAKSTSYAIFNFYKLKKLLFSLCVLNWILLTFGLFRIAVTRVMSVLFFSIPVSGTLPVKAVVFGYYIAAGSIIMLPLIAVILRTKKSMDERIMQGRILKYRIERALPELPWKRKYSYDVCIVRHLENGKMHRIYEEDRRLHTAGIGSTGGGKTATILTTAFEADLKQKVKNTDLQKKEVLKLLKAGKVEMTRCFDDTDFNIDYFKPAGSLKQHERGKIEKKLHHLKYDIKSAGLTVMCPNEAFCMELYDLAKAKELKVNLVDPCASMDGPLKDEIVGFSPIYVPIIEGEEESSYLFRVFTAAKLYADVNQAIFELSDKGDPYFTGLNRNIAVTAAVTVIIAYPLMHPGEYANIGHVQAIVNDFSQIRPYRETLIKKYGRPGASGNICTEIGKANVGPNLQFIIDRIDRDFLGENSAKINEQATGLRNIIDDSLMNPRIRNLLCAKKTLDIDRALDKGELTLINFEIALGSDSTGFGMFVLLSFIQAVLRRPGSLKTRIPHFFALDEAPVLLHPRLELSTTLFRQYNVAMMLFFQSLSQFEKNDATRYMRTVLTGNCAHQIIFGRASWEDMEFYKRLSGLKYEVEETETVRETALSDEKTSQAYSHSSTMEQNDRITSDDVRYREFLECTVFSAKNSTPLEPFLGKTNFLPRGYDPHMDRFRVNWNRYFVKTDTEEEETGVLVGYNSTGRKTQINTIDMHTPLFTAGNEPREEEREETEEEQTQEEETDSKTEDEEEEGEEI